MEEKYILVIDAGTQSIRAVLIDLKGNICEIEKTSIDAYFSSEPSYAEQDPEYLWDMLGKTTKALFAKSKIDINKIKGMSITTQRGTVINLDKDGKSLRPAIIWFDQRKAKLEKWPKGFTNLGFKLLNLYESITHAIRDGESNWIRQNQPEIWAKTNKFLLLSGYLSYKLCGEYVDSVGSTVGFIPFDYKKQKYSKQGSINLKMFPIERDKLADLVQPSELLGNITKQASQQTGVPEGLPIIAAAADKSCEVLGSGCISPEIACLSFGTTATIQTVNKKYVEVINFFPPYPSAIPHYYNTEMMIYRGYWMINWFKQEFGHKEIELSKKTGKESEELFDEMINDVPPGSMGLTLQPYWSPGVKVPGVEAKGAIIGFGDVHKRSHLYRSILEGLAYALKEGAMQTEKKTKVKIEKLRVSGGGSQSKNALQLTADIFDMPVEKPHTYETSALGAAINAAVGLKIYPNFNIAIEKMCRVGEVYYPIPENRDIYKKLYSKVYKKMYKKLKPLYSDIRTITNYPKKYED